jgi:hypothetical protein
MSRRSRLFVSTQVKDWGRSPLARIPDTDLTVDVRYLVIAGAGGGAASFGGGGGAGGYRCNVPSENSGGGASAEATFSALLGESLTVTVGGGGTKGSQSNSSPYTDTEGTSGSNSVFSTVTSTGGGYCGITGGSGGGSESGASYGAGTTNQGYRGGRRLEVASTATTQAAAEALVQSEEMRSRLPAEGMEALGSLLASPDRQ